MNAAVGRDVDDVVVAEKSKRLGRGVERVAAVADHDGG